MNMKKVALGCLGVFVVLVVIGGVAGYFFVYKPAAAYIASLKQFGEIATLDKNVTNKATFTPPDGNALTEEMVSRFVKVQEAMEARLGARSAELKAKYDQLDKLQKDQGRSPSLGEVLTALKDLSGIIVDGKRAQVDALNQAGFSLEEYAWVRSQVYAAAGLALNEINLRSLDPQKIAEAAKAGGNQSAPMTKVGSDENVPEHNKELVKPYAEKLQQWIALGFFGL
jgi:hypothetical protein